MPPKRRATMSRTIRTARAMMSKVVKRPRDRFWAQRARRRLSCSMVVNSRGVRNEPRGLPAARGLHRPCSGFSSDWHDHAPGAIESAVFQLKRQKALGLELAGKLERAGL